MCNNNNSNKNKKNMGSKEYKGSDARISNKNCFIPFL